MTENAKTSADGPSRLGFLLTEEQTRKVHILSSYMNKSPEQLIPQSIDEMWKAYERITRADDG